MKACRNSASAPAWRVPEINWEQFLGVKLFAWLGGLALFLAAAFFLKYSFDHDLILATGLDRLRSKLEYTTLAFQLLPEVFSILELKHIYEQILGEELDKGNFYRKIKDANVLEDTGMRREGRGRPTTLYRFRRNRGDEQFVFRWREARIVDDEG